MSDTFVIFEGAVQDVLLVWPGLRVKINQILATPVGIRNAKYEFAACRYGKLLHKVISRVRGLEQHEIWIHSASAFINLSGNDRAIDGHDGSKCYPVCLKPQFRPCLSVIKRVMMVAVHDHPCPDCQS